MHLSKGLVSKRLTYGLAAGAVLVVELVIALYIHDSLIRPYLGDSLAVVLVYLGLRAISPASVSVALVIALGTATIIEFGQLFHVLDLVGLSHNRIARIILGTGFDLKDFIAYGAGGGLVWLVEAL
eukprot:gene15128-19128_t